MKINMKDLLYLSKKSKIIQKDVTHYKNTMNSTKLKR